MRGFESRLGLSKCAILASRRGGGIGRHGSLKHFWPHGLVGSTPTLGTILKANAFSEGFLAGRSLDFAISSRPYLIPTNSFITPHLAGVYWLHKAPQGSEKPRLVRGFDYSRKPRSFSMSAARCRRRTHDGRPTAGRPLTFAKC
jgi:hypothetical protein